jgi:DNA-binding FadR family transcriptional regulator
MQNALKTMTATPYGSVGWLKAELEFHLAITYATRNPYMTQFLGFVSEKVRESILAAGSSHHSDEMAGATLAEHEAILATIQAGNAEGAHFAMRKHLDNAAERVGLSVNGNDGRAKPAIHLSRSKRATALHRPEG